MKKICKQAGIKIPPNIYRGKTGAALEEAFDALLEKYDLTQHSNSVDISVAAKRLQKEKDLEGKSGSWQTKRPLHLSFESQFDSVSLTSTQ